VQAHERAVERGCEAMQVFNQSPRMWRPTRWKPSDVAEFLSLRKKSPVRSVMIHAVYLINPATKDRAMRKKSADSLIHALRMGDEIKADGVVLHPGSTVGEPHDEALARAGEMVKHALSESESCRLLLENTAGAGNTLGRSFEELRELIDLAGGEKRLGVCLDSCHMFASGFDIRTRAKLDEVVEDFRKTVGIRRLRCLHLNDSMTPLGSNRDRHAIPGEGEIGKAGCAAFLSEPRFEGLPALFEGPGTTGHAPDKVDVDKLKKLRAQGLRSRKRRTES
jgi:deoxyribonuclease-4